jgi:hypothetical protein
VLAVIFVVVGLVYAVLAAPTDEDRAAAAFLDARMANRPEAPGQPTGGTGLNGTGLNGTGLNGTGLNGSGFNGSGLNGPVNGSPRTDPSAFPSAYQNRRR